MLAMFAKKSVCLFSNFQMKQDLSQIPQSIPKWNKLCISWRFSFNEEPEVSQDW
jgi:hypothetical protein